MVDLRKVSKEEREWRLARQVGGVCGLVAVFLLALSAWLFSFNEPNIKFAVVILDIFFCSLAVIFSSQIDAILRPALRKFDLRMWEKFDDHPPPEDQWLAQTTEEPGQKQ
jgi:hypothetical protein